MQVWNLPHYVEWLWKILVKYSLIILLQNICETSDSRQKRRSAKKVRLNANNIDHSCDN